MRFTPRQLIMIFGVLAFALIAGGKRGQDTIAIPKPSLSDDFLLSRLPATSLRIDSSELLAADGEKTDLLGEIAKSLNLKGTTSFQFNSEYQLDAFRGAPALRLVGDFDLPLAGFGVNPQDLTVVLVAKTQDLPEFQILSYTISSHGQGLKLIPVVRDGGRASSLLGEVQLKSSQKLSFSKGLEVAELIVLAQPLSSLQAENISESLYRKWIDQQGL